MTHQAISHPALFLRTTGYATHAPHALQISKTIGKRCSPVAISFCHFFNFLAQDLLSFAVSCPYHSLVIGSWLPCGSDFHFHSGDLSRCPQKWLVFVFSCGFNCLLLHLPVCSFEQFQSTVLWSVILLWIQVTILLRIQLFFLVLCLPDIESNYFGVYCSNPGTENAYAYSYFIGCSPNLIWSSQELPLHSNVSISLHKLSLRKFIEICLILKKKTQSKQTKKSQPQTKPKPHYFYRTGVCSHLKYLHIYLAWAYFQISAQEFISSSLKDWTERLLLLLL